jgi:hypothetical protein
MANIKITFVQGLQGPAGPAGIPDLSSLPQYPNDAAAIADGLQSGDPYWVIAPSAGQNGHDTLPVKVLTFVS